MRLDRWLVNLGVGSRSQVQKMIRSGLVAADGVTVTHPETDLDPETCHLAVRGETLDGRLIRHVMLNKPAGVLTAARDPRQPTVMDLLPPVYTAIGCMPVGRLDKNTTGLLVLTCDGEMNHRLLSPSRHVDKIYQAKVEGRLGEKEIAVFAAGIPLDDFTALPASLEILDAGDTASEARVTVREGKFHQVRRMFSVVGHEVLTLQRIAFGPLTIGSAPPEGLWRELTESELRALREAARMEDPTGNE